MKGKRRETSKSIPGRQFQAATAEAEARHPPAFWQERTGAAGRIGKKKIRTYKLMGCAESSGSIVAHVPTR